MDWESGALTDNVSVAVEERTKAIAAVSVSTITKLTRPDGGLIIHGKKIYHVTLIAQVYEILDNSMSKIHVLVDDYTSGGPLQVTHIIGDTGAPDDDFSMCESQGETKSIHALEVGDYIRAIGVVKYNQDAPNIVAYHMEHVHDPNDITNHCLEVIRDSMYLEKIQSSSNAPVDTGFGAPQQQPRNNNVEFGRLSNREKLILKVVRDKTDMDNERGVNINTLCECLKAFQREEIEESLNSLNAEGLCWQGDNEDIWHANAND